MKRLLKQAQKEYSARQRLVALIVEGVFFLIILPWGLVAAGRWLDGRLGWPSLPDGMGLIILAGLLTAVGFLFAFWAIYVQFTVGRGTPAPVMATQKLIVQPPYTYCRNPMALGTIGLYLGIAIFARSPGAILIVALFSALLLIYIKRVEEREMVLRFGEAYQAYRRETPFILPRWRKK